PAGPEPGAAVCPKEAVAAAAASVPTKRKCRRCKLMFASLFHGVMPKLSHKSIPRAPALGRGACQGWRESADLGGAASRQLSGGTPVVMPAEARRQPDRELQQRI